jgi:hypothetical protein
MRNQKEQVSSRFGKSNVRKGAGVLTRTSPKSLWGLTGS